MPLPAMPARSSGGAFADRLIDDLRATRAHESPFTLDRYAHVLPGMQEKAAAKLEALLFGR